MPTVAEEIKLFRKCRAYQQIKAWCSAINCPKERKKEVERLTRLAVKRKSQHDTVEGFSSIKPYWDLGTALGITFRFSPQEEKEMWESISRVRL